MEPLPAPNSVEEPVPPTKIKVKLDRKVVFAVWLAYILLALMVVLVGGLILLKYL